MSAIYFTSDTHFGHTNIIEYCKRPFRDTFHMNEAVVVGCRDTTPLGNATKTTLYNRQAMSNVTSNRAFIKSISLLAHLCRKTTRETLPQITRAPV